MTLAQTIQRMDELKSELDSLRPIREDRLNRLNQKLRLDWNYHSNSIEGNTLTMSETRSFLLWGVTAKGKPFRDYVEVKGHNEALLQLEKIVHDDLKITENLIKGFHKTILVEPYQDKEVAEINPGHYKTLPNYLYSPTNERIDFSPPEDVPKLMNELINWTNNHLHPPKRKKKDYDLHPLLIAAGFHSQFIKVHPFGDGNGRMARILTNLILMQKGYVPAVIKLDDRKPYYTAINTSNLEEPEELALVLGAACIESLEMAISAGKGEDIGEDEDWKKKLNLVKKRLAAEENEAIPKSEVILTTLSTKGLIPLIERIEQTLTEIAELFYQKQFELKANGTRIADYHDLEEIVPLLNKKGAQMVLEYSLEGFKKNGANAFGAKGSIVFHLSDYSYSITGNPHNNLLNSRTYNIQIDPSEISSIAGTVGEAIVDYIQSAIER